MQRKTGLKEMRVCETAEIRVDHPDDGTRKIHGYAAIFDALSQPLFGFREVIKPGAFKKTLKEADVRALHNHDPNYVLGRKSARTLRLKEDEKGLAMEIDPPDTSFANDLLVSIERGDVNQSSFGFTTVKDFWFMEGDTQIRELREVKLLDVSVVTFPAYHQTEVHVRAVLDSFGIAPDRLAAALFRAQAGQALSEEERRMIAATMDVMREYVQLEPRGDAHSAGPPVPVLPNHTVPGLLYDPMACLQRLRLVELI